MADRTKISGVKFLIVGGGIGGLMSALGLLRAGFDVRVLEQAPVLAEVGAGLTIQPSATRAVDFVGLGDRLRAIADISERSFVYHYRTGEVLGEKVGIGTPVDAEGRSWYHRIHRADFQSMLVDAVNALSPGALSLGSKVVAIRQDDASVTATLENGERLTADALIGADGIRSVARGCVAQEEAPLFRGQVAYRMLLPMETVADLLEGRPEGTYIGPGRMFNRYPIRKGTVLNCVGIVGTSDWTGEGWTSPATRQEFLEKYEGWHPSLTGLIERFSGDSLIKWALYDRAPLPTWSRGRITLLGDAAHPMLPFLGLAGAMAVEDAVVLARSCAASPDDLAFAFQSYEAVRKPRTNEIFLKSREQGRIFQDPDTDSYASKRPPNTDPQIFAYDPATVALPGR
jgi:salicylate hydroxylase